MHVSMETKGGVGGEEVALASLRPTAFGAESSRPFSWNEFSRSHVAYRALELYKSSAGRHRNDIRHDIMTKGVERQRRVGYADDVMDHRVLSILEAPAHIGKQHRFGTGERESQPPPSSRKTCDRLLSTHHKPTH